MKPVDSFFEGLRGAFRPDDDVGPLFLILAVVLLAGALVGLYVRRRRRARAPRDALRRLIAGRRLSPAHVETLDALAVASGADPLLIGSRLDAFERATGAVFSRQPPVLIVKPQDLFARTRLLRQALGFANLPEHFPLLTTRELTAGAPVDLGGLPVVVAEVNEAHWVVHAAGPPPVNVGASVAAVVIRAQDARYDLNVRLLAVAPIENGRAFQLSHDEAPRRSQHRDFVRVAAHGPVRVRPVPARIGPQPPSLDELTGSLVDISLGGMALHILTPLPPGVDVAVAFEFAGDSYRNIAALVLDCHPVTIDSLLLRLSFRKLPAEDEQRLAAAINSFTARPIVSDPS